MIQISKLILAIIGEREIHVSHDVISQQKRALVDKNLRVELDIFQTRLSICVAILTKLFQEVTERNQISVSFGQHDFNNFCNLDRLILQKSSLTPVLVSHKKGILLLKRAFLGENQRLVKRLSNQTSSLRLGTY